jgi:hypothetical protein
MKLFDWISRVIMLVLAGLVSLSIIGAIASIPSGSIPTTMIETAPSAPQPDFSAESAPEPSPPEAAPGPVAQPAAPGAAVGTVAPPPPQEADGAEAWLESIFYALLALVGIGALATLLLWRSLQERRRLADAVETVAARLRA